MARVKVLVATVSGKNVTQKEFDVEMATVRRALSVIEEERKKTASERLRIASVAKKGSTVHRIGAMKRKNQRKDQLGMVAIKG